MNILIIGPGAIGCLFAGLLSEGGHAVQILDKNAKRTALLNKQGIKIKDGKTRTAKIPVITNAAEAETPRFICICVKSFDTESAIQHSINAIDANTNVVSIQNGIGNAEIIAEHIKPEKALCATTSQGATLLKLGSIKRAGAGPTSVAPFVPESLNAAQEFAELLTASGIEASAQDNALSLLWSKLIISAAINPVTALSDLTNGEILKSSELKEVMREAASEAEDVAHAKGITLYYENAADEAEKICRATKNNISSMLQDVRADRKTEIKSITGAIIKEARALNVDAPTNEVLMKRINKLSEQAQ